MLRRVFLLFVLTVPGITYAYDTVKLDRLFLEAERLLLQGKLASEQQPDPLAKQETPQIPQPDPPEQQPPAAPVDPQKPLEALNCPKLREMEVLLADMDGDAESSIARIEDLDNQVSQITNTFREGAQNNVCERETKSTLIDLRQQFADIRVGKRAIESQDMLICLDDIKERISAAMEDAKQEGNSIRIRRLSDQQTSAVQSLSRMIVLAQTFVDYESKTSRRIEHLDNQIAECEEIDKNEF